MKLAVNVAGLHPLTTGGLHNPAGRPRHGHPQHGRVEVHLIPGERCLDPHPGSHTAPWVIHINRPELEWASRKAVKLWLIKFR